MKYLYVLFISMCLAASVTACNKTADGGQSASTAQTASADEAHGEEWEPPEGIQEEAPQAQSGSATSFSPEEIRDYCAYVAQNAQYFFNLKVNLISTPKRETLDEMIAMLEEAYQFNTNLNVTDDDRKMLASTLWVTKAFVENSPTYSRYVAEGQSLGPGFAAANEQWCQKSMRGNQPPFQLFGEVVPYVEFQRN